MLNPIVPEFIYQLKNNDNLWKLFDSFIQSSFQVNFIKKLYFVIFDLQKKMN